MLLRKLSQGAWHGYDYDARRLAFSGPGSEVEMSERRAERIMADFPGAFEVVGATGTAPQLADAPGGATDDPAPTTPTPTPPTPKPVRRVRRGK
jgi:hypothetical protein